MHLAGFPPVFLLFVWLRATFARVEPPSNVTLHCHNLQNILEWSYSDPLPGLEFRVDVRSVSSAPHNFSVHPPTLQADISFLISYLSDDYYLTVTAVIDQNESEPAPPDGITFSYFMNSLAHQKCFMDFPPVNVTADQDDHLLFQFIHPWLFYDIKLPSRPDTNSRKKRRHDPKTRTPIPEFMYDVVAVNQDTSERFCCEERLCKGKLPVNSAQEKHCLKVTGELQKMLVQSTQEYCTLPLKVTAHNLYIYVAVVSLFALIAVALVLYMVYKRKTRPSNSSARSLTFTSQLKQVLEPEKVPTSPTPLLLNIEEKESKESTPSVSSSTDPDLRLPIAGPPEDEGMCDIVELANGEGPGYKHGDLDAEDGLSSSGIPSGYEKR